MKKLLVVESPTKAKTIGRYLGKDYKVVATVGHIRDLPKNKMAVDMDKNFEIEYQIDSKKKKVIEELNKSAKEADMVLLASDPDREGEAISWHVKWILQNGKSKIKDEKISRVVFHEITKEAIEKALTEAREIDMDLVNAQQARRVLDRVVGYSLSPILWKKVRRGLSGGRVQSVAVRLICEREKEIEAFKKEKFWTISVEAGKKETFTAQLVKWKGKSVFINTKLKLFDGDYTYSKSIFKTEAEVKRLVESVGKELIVDKGGGRKVLGTQGRAFQPQK